MAMLHGTVGEFNIEREDWSAYAERLQQYFTANDVDSADKQRAVLLSACGPTTYKLMRNLVSPRKPGGCTFAELVDAVHKHYVPRPSIIVHRFRFHSCSRSKGDSVATFVAELRRLTEHCEFGAVLDDMLRDRLVCGINKPRLQRRLLSEAALTFKSAFELAQAYESAERDVNDLHLAPQPSAVHSVRKEHQERRDHYTAAPGRKPYVRANSATDSACNSCGGTHARAECQFRRAVCRNCGKSGHIARVCRSKSSFKKQPPQRPPAPAQANQVCEDEQEEVETYSLFTLTTNRTKPVVVTPIVDGKDLPMEVDTGAAVSLISNKIYRSLWSGDRKAPTLQPTNAKLRTYTREEITVLGCIEVEVRYEGQQERLRLLVVANDGPALFGRDWLNKITLNWKALSRTPSTPARTLAEVLDQHEAVFADGLGTVRGVTAKIHVDPQASPRFCKARPIPYALRNKVAMELERLEKQGIIEPVEFADWAAPIVSVLKKDGSVRICGDYKLTVNRASKLDKYPLPRIEDLFASLAGGKSKLDLAHAYQQVTLDEDSKRFVCINTPKGLYQYTRLPFGVASAPSLFQRVMENLLQGLPHVVVYLDDILVTGATEDEHIRNVEEVLRRLETAGMRLKRSKCAFMLSEVEYLGHRITAEGLRPTPEKTRAIVNAPAPQSVSQLKSFLGLVNYYAKFLPNLSSTLAPLYSLLQKYVEWSWGKDQEEAFQRAKQLLTSSNVLAHYDPTRELLLACDASPYGIGAVLSLVMADGSDKPVAFASRSLTPAEKRYSQLYKEHGLHALNATSGTDKTRRTWIYIYRHTTGRHTVGRQPQRGSRSVAAKCMGRSGEGSMRETG